MKINKIKILLNLKNNHKIKVWWVKNNNFHQINRLIKLRMKVKIKFNNLIIALVKLMNLYSIKIINNL